MKKMIITALFGFSQILSSFLLGVDVLAQTSEGKTIRYQFMLSKKKLKPDKPTVNPQLPPKKIATSLQKLAIHAAQKYRIPVKLFLAIVQQESSWQPHAISKRGAVGLTQLMPQTAKTYCQLQYSELKDPAKNLDCGAKYFSAQVQRFGSLRKAVCSFNAGPTMVAKWGRCPPFKETQDYVKQVMNY